MRSTHRFVAAAAIAGLVGLLMFPPAAAAQGGYGAGKGSWTVRGFGVWLDTGGDTIHFRSIDPLPPVGESSFELGDGDGVGLALEYRVTRRFGVEALAIQAAIEGEFRTVFTVPPIPEQVVTEDVDVDLYGVGVNFHLTPTGRVDVYVGPTIAYVRYGDFRAQFNCGDTFAPCTFGVDDSDDTAFGATLGADVAVGRSGQWAVSGAVRQLWSSVQEGTFFEIEVDPLIATAGVAYRFGG